MFFNLTNKLFGKVLMGGKMAGRLDHIVTSQLGRGVAAVALLTLSIVIGLSVAMLYESDVNQIQMAVQKSCC